MVGSPGLRERKKQKTRLLIAETARNLFAERGFEMVSVAEIARAAEVSEATVFNYFPTKEDLVYQGMEVFAQQLVQAIRERPSGEPVIDAYGRFVLEPRGLLAAENEESARMLVQVSRLITASPALLARERQILARYSEALTELLAEETGAGPSDLRPNVVAASLIELHGALIGFVRRRIVEGSSDTRRLARDLRAEGERALELLRRGFGDYARKGPERARRPGGRAPARPLGVVR
ncbi:MAG: TetR family transcriptional regulator [Acidimicrobiales bacterium]|nr:TetR family transcriptional regulator [Acidimicrobiales bacterium]